MKTKLANNLLKSN